MTTTQIPISNEVLHPHLQAGTRVLATRRGVSMSGEIDEVYQDPNEQRPYSVLLDNGRLEDFEAYELEVDCNG